MLTLISTLSLLISGSLQNLTCTQIRAHYNSNCECSSTADYHELDENTVTFAGTVIGTCNDLRNRYQAVCECEDS